MKFWSLYKKEMRSEAPSFFILLAVIFGWSVWVFSKPELPTEMTFVLVSLPLVMIPFYAVLRVILDLRSEWAEDTIQLLVSLPVRGWQVLGAKGLAIITEVILLAMVISGLLYTILSSEQILRLAMVEWVPVLALLILLGFAAFLPVLYLGYLIGRGVPVGRGVVSFISFGLLTYLWTNSAVLADKFLPSIAINVHGVAFDATGVHQTVGEIPVTFLGGFVVCGLVMFAARAYLWEKRIDV